MQGTSWAGDSHIDKYINLIGHTVFSNTLQVHDLALLDIVSQNLFI